MPVWVRSHDCMVFSPSCSQADRASATRTAAVSRASSRFRSATRAEFSASRSASDIACKRSVAAGGGIEYMFECYRRNRHLAA